MTVETTRADILAERARVHQEDMQLLMAVPWGRRLAAWIFDDLGGLRKQSFNAESGGYNNAAIKDGNAAAMHMAHHEGRRAVAVDLYQALEGASPKGIALLETERADKRAKDLERLEMAMKEQK